MNKKQLLNLWEMRFRKILALEEDSAVLYKTLFRDYDHLLGGSRIKIIVRKMMREEAEHVHLTEKLLEIVLAQKSQSAVDKTSSLEVG